jgi:hypothetical protein
MIYHDAEQYRLACELWQRERLSNAGSAFSGVFLCLSKCRRE